MDDDTSKTRTVVIQGRETTLVAPGSYALRAEIWMAVSENRMRGLAAALGVCWRRPRRPTANYAACRYNPHVYGGAVLDELMERGIPLTEIIQAAGVAYELVITGLVSEEDVAEAEGFTDQGDPEPDSPG